MSALVRAQMLDDAQLAFEAGDHESARTLARLVQAQAEHDRQEILEGYIAQIGPLLPLLLNQAKNSLG